MPHTTTKGESSKEVSKRDTGLLLNVSWSYILYHKWVWNVGLNDCEEKELNSISRLIPNLGTMYHNRRDYKPKCKNRQIAHMDLWIGIWNQHLLNQKSLIDFNQIHRAKELRVKNLLWYWKAFFFFFFLRRWDWKANVVFLFEKLRFYLFWLKQKNKKQTFFWKIYSFFSVC